ncbi:MAG: sigma-70 family RNA polymerase sigma factor [Clostridia bacterium]|nr:sigma-70 family RNA polymerase sigma factor [Clostridia bacterium]
MYRKCACPVMMHSGDDFAAEPLDDLLRRIREGQDAAAFDRLCERYSRLLDAMVRQFAPSMGIQDGGTSDLLGIGTEELRQDAAMVLYKAACTYVPDEEGKGGDVSFGLYAKICIRNAMISQVRRYNRMKKRLTAEKQDAKSPVREIVEAEVLAGETMRRIQAELSAYEKRILPLYLAGKPPREIAVILGRTEKSVSNGIYRIKSKIRQMLEMY